MNPVSSLQAALVALATQTVALLVGFAVLSSNTQGVVINTVTAAINVAFLIANSIHAHAATQ